jgi:hypothetical protein
MRGPQLKLLVVYMWTANFLSISSDFRFTWYQSTGLGFKSLTFAILQKCSCPLSVTYRPYGVIREILFTCRPHWFTCERGYYTICGLPTFFSINLDFWFYWLTLNLTTVRLFLYCICMTNICIMVGCYKFRTLNCQIDIDSIAFDILDQLTPVLCYSHLISLWYLSWLISSFQSDYEHAEQALRKCISLYNEVCVRSSPSFLYLYKSTRGISRSAQLDVCSTATDIAILNKRYIYCCSLIHEMWCLNTSGSSTRDAWTASCTLFSSIQTSWMRMGCRIC